MSEYQYYEFLAIDRPLDDTEQAEIRSMSTRAEISATSFVNEYHWGDFKGDPNQLMRRFYDAHLYVANWGTHRIMLRLPRTFLDPTAIRDYLVDAQVTAHTTGEFVVLDITSEDHNGEFDFDHDPTTLLSALVGVRAELIAGDLRPLYLAWLAGYGAWERDEDVFDRDADGDLEPPVPPGLSTLTAPQRALAEFLRLDEDLLAVAAQTIRQRIGRYDRVARAASDCGNWADMEKYIALLDRDIALRDITSNPPPEIVVRRQPINIFGHVRPGYDFTNLHNAAAEEAGSAEVVFPQVGAI